MKTCIRNKMLENSSYINNLNLIQRANLLKFLFKEINFIHWLSRNTYEQLLKKVRSSRVNNKLNDIILISLKKKLLRKKY